MKPALRRDFTVLALLALVLGAAALVPLLLFHILKHLLNRGKQHD